jgi:ketosteroid isomerase-like protein
VSEPSSEELAAIGRASFAAVARGDIDAALEGLHESVIIDLSRSRAPYRGVYEGRPAVRKLWQEFLEVWEAIDWEFEVFARPATYTLIMESRPTARGTSSGITFGGRGGWLWRFRDGKLAFGALFQSPEDALAELEDR